MIEEYNTEELTYLTSLLTTDNLLILFAIAFIVLIVFAVIEFSEKTEKIGDAE